MAVGVHADGYLPMFKDLTPLTENHFDFSVTAQGSTAYLELQEIAPRTRPDATAPAQYKPYDRTHSGQLRWPRSKSAPLGRGFPRKMDKTPIHPHFSRCVPSESRQQNGGEWMFYWFMPCALCCPAMKQFA